MKYITIDKDGLLYYKGEDGNVYGDGYLNAYDFAPNGLAQVEKTDRKYYYINDKFETVSEGFRSIDKFAPNGMAIVEKEDGLKYYINEKCEIISGGYKKAYEFESNGLTIVQEEDGKIYYINEKFEIVSKGYEWASSFDKKGFARVKEKDGKYYYINEKFEIVSEGYKTSDEIKLKEITPLDQYLNGEIEVYDLPNDCFVGENLDKIMANEKKLYRYLVNMASKKEQLDQIKEDSQRKAEYIKDRAYEVYAVENKREELLNEENDLF